MTAHPKKSESIDELVRDLTQAHPLSKSEVRTRIEALYNQRMEKVVYGFHEYIMGKDIIRPEKDQAFNYGRLHHAIDNYIEDLRTRAGINKKEEV